NHGKGRGDRNPSLSISDGDDGALLLFCFAGCTFEDIIDALDRRGLVENDREPQEARVAEVAHLPSAEALMIWRAAVPLNGTIAAEYLNRRGIPAQPASLRCRLERPALIAAVQAPDGKIIAIQQTRLTKEGEKLSRLMTGHAWC